MVLEFQVPDIVEAIGISHGSVVSIPYDHPYMGARLLTTDNKYNRVITLKEYLASFNCNLEGLLRIFISEDNDNTPKNKHE